MAQKLSSYQTFEHFKQNCRVIKHLSILSKTFKLSNIQAFAEELLHSGLCTDSESDGGHDKIETVFWPCPSPLSLMYYSNMAAHEQPIRLQDCHVWLADQRLGVFGWLTKAQ